MISIAISVNVSGLGQAQSVRVEEGVSAAEVLEQANIPGEVDARIRGVRVAAEDLAETPVEDGDTILILGAAVKHG